MLIKGPFPYPEVVKLAFRPGLLYEAIACAGLVAPAKPSPWVFGGALSQRRFYAMPGGKHTTVVLCCLHSTSLTFVHSTLIPQHRASNALADKLQPTLRMKLALASPRHCGTAAKRSLQRYRSVTHDKKC